MSLAACEESICENGERPETESRPDTFFVCATDATESPERLAKVCKILYDTPVLLSPRSTKDFHEIAYSSMSRSNTAFTSPCRPLSYTLVPIVSPSASTSLSFKASPSG